MAALRSEKVSFLVGCGALARLWASPGSLACPSRTCGTNRRSYGDTPLDYSVGTSRWWAGRGSKGTFLPRARESCIFCRGASQEALNNLSRASLLRCAFPLAVRGQRLARRLGLVLCHAHGRLLWLAVRLGACQGGLV